MSVGHSPRLLKSHLASPSPLAFYETSETGRVIFVVVLATQAVSLWFVTAGWVRISSFPADSLYYLRQLPFTFWWGLAATLALLFSANLLAPRLRVALEISSLFLLALYVIGLPSFVFQNPRILDVYAHEGNALLILNSQGWVGSSGWYVRQFPGAYTFFAQLTSVSGISPFDLMKYYPVGCSLVIVLFLYSIARLYNPPYAGRVSALLLGGLWFQLHLSPQSLELILYLGILYIFVKMLFDSQRLKQWTILSIVSIPVFVVSHPETPVVMILGTAALLLLSMILPGLRSAVRPALSRFGVFFLALFGWAAVWWFTFASEARVLIQNIAVGAISSALSAKRPPLQTVPSTPAYTYQLAVFLEQGVSVTVWLLGLSLLLLTRGRMRGRDGPLWGLFIAAVSTAPLTFYVRADMLQRSYLFSLLPATILFAVALSHRSDFKIFGRSAIPLFKVMMITAMIVFLVLMPVTRNAVDPYEYIPGSSLFASNLSAELSGQSHSVLFLYNGEYAWRFYAALDGDRIGVREEQKNLGPLSGAFVKPNSTVTIPGAPFNLTFTTSDSSSHYIVLSDYYQNLYVLRFGQISSYYIDQKNAYEGQVSLHFNLVYSTGTDRMYTNPDM